MDGRYQSYENYFNFSDPAFAGSEQRGFAAQDTFNDNTSVDIRSSVSLSHSQNQNSTTMMSREFRSFEQEDTRLGLQQVDRLYFEMPGSMNPQMKSTGGARIESRNLNITGSHSAQGMQARLPRQDTDMDMRVNEYPSNQFALEDRLDRIEPYQTHHNPALYVQEESYESVSAFPSRDNLQQRQQVYTGSSESTIFTDNQSIPQDRYWRDDYDDRFHHGQEQDGYKQFGKEGDERFAADPYPDQAMYCYGDDMESESYDGYRRRYSPQRDRNTYKSSEHPGALDYPTDNFEMSTQDRWVYSREGNYTSESAWKTREVSAPRSRGKYPPRGRGRFMEGGPHFGGEIVQGQNQNRRGKPLTRTNTPLGRQNQMRGRGGHRGSGPYQGRGRGRGQKKPSPAKMHRGGKIGACQETAGFMEDSANASQECGQKSEHGGSKEEDTLLSNKQYEEKPMQVDRNLTDSQCRKSDFDSGMKTVEVKESETQNKIAAENPSESSTTKNDIENKKGSFGTNVSSRSEENALNSTKKDFHLDGKEDGDEENQNEEDTSFCKLCAMSFDNSEQYLRHTRGLLHTQRLMAQNSDKSGQPKHQDTDSGSQEEHNAPVSQQTVQAQDVFTDKPARSSESSVQKNASAETSQGLALINSSGFGEDEDFEDEDEFAEGDGGEDEAVNKGDSEEYRCKLCDIKTTGPVSMRAHLSGRNHKMVQEALEKGFPLPFRLMKKIGPDAQVPLSEARIPVGLVQVSGPSMLTEALKTVPEAVVGLRAVKEYQLTKQPTFTCTLCDAQCDLSSIQTHVLGSKHRMKYLKANHPEVYEHVKTHGGKKSQLSAFLEEVCSDIEAKEGRGAPSVQKPAAGENPDKEEGERAEVSQEPSKPASNDDEKDAGSANSSKTPTTFTKRLPHEVVVARYQEEKRRKEVDDQNFGRFEGGRGRGRHHRHPNPPDFGFPEGRRGRGRPYSDYNRFPDHPPGPHGDDRWGRESVWNRVPEHFYGPPGARHRPQDRRTRSVFDEEDRIRRMYEYEHYSFYHPAVGISRQEEQRRMMYEYERLGIPFEEARRRMLIQEERRMRLADMMRSGMPLDEARQRIMADENRVLLLQEYERQGLSPREARHRIIVEEESQKLLDEYERKGIASIEARRRIMSGDNRLHFIREFERRGMTLEEARILAYREEEQQQRFLDLIYGDAFSTTPYRRPEPLSESALLKRHLQQGLKLEDAKNKVIACLRAEGIPTHEAILRVEKIEVTPDMLLPEENKKPSDEREQGPSSEAIKAKACSEREDKMQTNIKMITNIKMMANIADDDLDISMEEAKERLLQEYMRRGVPREEARQSLISELIRQGVSPEEARRRFRDAPKAYQTEGHSSSPDPRSRTERRDRSNRSRSSSSSRTGSPSRPRDKGRRPRPFYMEDREKGRRFSRESYASEKHERSKDERHNHREVHSDRKARSPEHHDPPTLTLGEELKRMKMKRRLEAYEKEIELKQAKTFASSLSETPTTSTYGKSKTLQPQPTTSHDPGIKSDVKDLLESLTNNLISSEDDAATALQVSKALTSALLKYRFKASPNEEGPKYQQSLASFPERRLSDAKKLFEPSSKT